MYDRKRYAKWRRLNVESGSWQPFGDIEKVRAHISHLRRSGWTGRGISKASGVAESTVWRLENGSGTKVKSRVAEKILQVDGLPPDDCLIPAYGAARRLHALGAIGHSLRYMEGRTGVSWQTLHMIRSGKSVSCFSSTHWAIVRVYDELTSETLPGKNRVSTRLRNRFSDSPNPWQLEDDLIDLPEPEYREALSRRAQEMTDAELQRCYLAKRDGDISPLILAGNKEHRKRRWDRERYDRWWKAREAS
jgi:transcriptional regulator with XRE-family HTH domain